MPDMRAQVEVKPGKGFAEFLETTPPNVEEDVTDLCEQNKSSLKWELADPDIQLHCSSAACDGPRFFGCNNNEVYPTQGTWKNGFPNLFL